MTELNISIFYSLYNLSQVEVIKNVALFFSYWLGYILPIALIGWTLLFSNRRMYSFSFITLSAFSSWIFGLIIKNLLHISRPFISLKIAPLFYETGFSFPSLHAAVFAGIAVASYFLNKKMGIILLFIAFLVGISRIVIGVHYPVDVLFGFFVGTVTSLILIKIFKRI